VRSPAAKEIRVHRCSSVVSAFARFGETGKFFARPRLCVETNQRLNRVLIEREDGFGYQALTEFAENVYASWI